MKKLDKEKFLKNIKKYQGILKPGEGKKLLKELRKEDFEREKKLTKRKKIGKIFFHFLYKINFMKSFRKYNE